MTNMIRLQDLYTAKLAHYNAWLLNRPMGEKYPGFPGDAEIESLQNPGQKVRASKAKLKTIKTGAPRAAKTGTKLAKARTLFKANSGAGREAIVAMFITELNMTKSGATTYYYNCKK